MTASVTRLVLSHLGAPQGLLRLGLAASAKPQLPDVRAAGQRVLQVAQYPIDNTLKSASPGHVLCVSIACIGCDGASGWPVPEAQDECVGRGPTYAERQSVRFGRLDPTQPGAGLGLALVHRILELHAGRFWAESAGLGQGASHCFTLPPARASAKGERV
ncbi:MAG: hypothetical protein HZB16_13405 [Armatimonadetes bacterium]|nr:hypothetical protein [Armatimonadota bacterium]